MLGIIIYNIHSYNICMNDLTLWMVWSVNGLTYYVHKCPQLWTIKIIIILYITLFLTKHSLIILFIDSQVDQVNLSITTIYFLIWNNFQLLLLLLLTIVYILLYLTIAIAWGLILSGNSCSYYVHSHCIYIYIIYIYSFHI